MLANPQKAHLFSVKMMRIDTVAGLLTTALSRTYPPLLPPHIQEMFQNPNGMLPLFLFFWCAKRHILTYAPLKCLFTLDTPPPPYSCAMLMLMLRARALYSKTSKKHSYAKHLSHWPPAFIPPPQNCTFALSLLLLYILCLRAFAYALDCILFYILHLSCSIWVMHAVLLVSTLIPAFYICVFCATLLCPLLALRS